jgi:uncharacterized protein (DUF1015 family)
MVSANPFRGLRFDPAVVGDPGLVIAPPYDVISPEARDAYEAASPYNMVRVILAREPDGRYDQVGKLMASWVTERALVLDDTPCLYVYELAYRLGGERRVQRGVLATVPLDATRTWVLPHERTMAAPVEDRLRLLEATNANLSPVFGLYAAKGRTGAAVAAMTAVEPAIECTDEVGIEHRMWRVSDPDLIQAWRGALADLPVLIADGHHRYRTSLAFQERARAARPEAPDGPWDEVLMFLADADADGPSVLPIHRLCRAVAAERIVAAAGDVFTSAPLAGVAEAQAALARVAPEVPAFAVHGPEGTWLLTATDPARLADEVGLGRAPLDVEVLHGPVLATRAGVTDFEGAIKYEADAERAAAQVASGEFSALVLLRPVPVASVLEVARAGGTLPQKTTFFYPKPRDGLVMRPFDPELYAGPP